jgi:8-oxo-dGTP pyrophosphatase MutT (NUDIX family)
VEDGEPLLDGALRECFEETGLTPEIHPEWSVTLSKKKKKYHFYLGIVHTTSVQLSFEHDKAFWADARFVEKLKKPLRIAVQTAILFLE